MVFYSIRVWKIKVFWKVKNYSCDSVLRVKRIVFRFCFLIVEVGVIWYKNEWSLISLIGKIKWFLLVLSKF